jgi:hypothetical protein
VRQENATTIGKSGTWTRTTASGSLGGYVRRSKAAGARIWTTFTGSSIGWVSTLGPKSGEARVYVDGTLDKTINLYSPTTSTRRIVWSRTFGLVGQHRVEIRVSGTPGHPNVDLDAFVVLVNP